jgi:hypothetical protein
MKSGARILCNPTPDENGTVVLVDVGHSIRGHGLAGHDMPWLGDITPERGPFTLHQRTCGKAGKAPKATPCHDCGTALHPLIVARGGLWHWLCGPAPKPADLFTAAAAEPLLHVQADLLEAS